METPVKPLITKEALGNAITHAHDICGDECIHAKATTEMSPAIGKVIKDVILIAMQEGAPDSIPYDIYFAGLHAGYMLHKLETESPVGAAVN